MTNEKLKAAAGAWENSIGSGQTLSLHEVFAAGAKYGREQGLEEVASRLECSWNPETFKNRAKYAKDSAKMIRAVAREGEENEA